MVRIDGNRPQLPDGGSSGMAGRTRNFRRCAWREEGEGWWKRDRNRRKLPGTPRRASGKDAVRRIALKRKRPRRQRRVIRQDKNDRHRKGEVLFFKRKWGQNSRLKGWRLKTLADSHGLRQRPAKIHGVYCRSAPLKAPGQRLYSTASKQGLSPFLASIKTSPSPSLANRDSWSPARASLRKSI